MENLTDNKIIYTYQLEFCKNHLTDSCLSYLRNKILTGFDSGLLTEIVLIDLQKVFDLTNHEILLWKMSSSAQWTVWFGSYLSKGAFKWVSKLISPNNNCGVPQESLLVLLYVNDLFQAVGCNIQISLV